MFIRKDDMVEEGHAYRFCSLGKSCSNDAIEFSRRGVPADMVMYCKCWGQAPRSNLSAGARPQSKVFNIAAATFFVMKGVAAGVFGTVRES